MRFAIICAVIVSAVAIGAPTTNAHERRDPLWIDAPPLPLLPNTTLPTLFTCSSIDDCNAQAADYCRGFEYPKGRILFRTLAETPRPFPIYSVICFE